MSAEASLSATPQVGGGLSDDVQQKRDCPRKDEPLHQPVSIRHPTETSRMALSIEQIAAVLVPAVLALSWLIRLEGRINLQDARYAEIKEALTYIRERLDRALNGTSR